MVAKLLLVNHLIFQSSSEFKKLFNYTNFTITVSFNPLLSLSLKNFPNEYTILSFNPLLSLSSSTTLGFILRIVLSILF